jgi:hypothetical protein
MPKPDFYWNVGLINRLPNNQACVRFIMANESWTDNPKRQAKYSSLRKLFYVTIDG